jgi:uncharacterized membrane protein
MFVLAHILGVPVEELIMPWISGGVCAGVFMVLASYIGDFLKRLPLKLCPRNMQSKHDVARQNISGNV